MQNLWFTGGISFNLMTNNIVNKLMKRYIRYKDIRLTEGGLGIDSDSMRQGVSRPHSS